MLLWPRRQVPVKAALDALKRRLREQDRFTDLPRALLDHRLQEIGRQRPQPCDFSLLWDEPDRLGLEGLWVDYDTDHAFP